MTEMAEQGHRFFENRECKYYPCHEGVEHLNCLFCYCPLYHIKDCPGDPQFVSKPEGLRKVCQGCAFPHRAENYDRIISILKTEGFFKNE